MLDMRFKAKNRQDGTRAVDLPARSFDLARPVAPPLLFRQVAGIKLLNKDSDFEVYFVKLDGCRRKKT